MEGGGLGVLLSVFEGRGGGFGFLWHGGLLAWLLVGDGEGRGGMGE